MKSRLFAALALWPAWASGQASGGGHEAKPTPAPFYRKYLVPGNSLDDKIVEQERRVEAAPDDANLRNDFGNLLALRRFPEQAAEQYEMAIKLDKTNFISAYNLGLLRETEGKLSAAVSAYQRSIKRKPGFPQSHFRLGRAYELLNQPEPAVHEYAKAMWIDPAMRDARRNPLVIDSELIYLASLANYQKDVAVASMDDAHAYFDNDRFRKLPTDRAISAKEAEGDQEPELVPTPRNVGGPAPAAGAAGASEPPMRRGSSRTTAPPETVPGGIPRPVPGATRGKTPPRSGAPQPAQPAAPAPGTVEPPTPAPEAAPETPPESAPEPTPGPPPDDEPS